MDFDSFVLLNKMPNIFVRVIAWVGLLLSDGMLRPLQRAQRDNRKKLLHF